MHKKFTILVICWSILVICSLTLNLYILDKNNEHIIRGESRAYFNLLYTARIWNLAHDKVYVPISKTMQPNPYLVHPKRDAVSNLGDSLTMVDAAFMVRQFSEIASPLTNRFHSTSLNPIRPGNKPDEWEIKALKTFSKAGDSYFELVTDSSGSAYRYMEPLITELSCLDCHAAQGYKLGDVRGGISITTPYTYTGFGETAATIRKLAVIYVLIFMIGLLALLYCRKTINKYTSGIESKNDHLQQSNESKNKFLNILAHDLKMPAANIVSLSDILKSQLQNLSPDELHSYIDMLDESAKANHRLLTDLLDWSRVQTDRLQVIPERMNIKLVADTVFEQTSPQAQQKNITQVNQAGDCFVQADANMLITSMRNLVVNAIKFTNPGGQVIIRASYTDQLVKVSVEDTGIGISQERIAQIFEIGKSITSGTVSESGTGLGLVLCKEFIERNGGRIWVESVLGKGSVFIFTLPVGAAD